MVEEARNFFTQLCEHKRLHPNVQTYTIVIKGLCREHLVDEAYDMLRKMESICLPNEWTYNVTIRGFILNKGLAEEESLIDEMMSKGFDFDEITFSLLCGIMGKIAIL
ncbi:Putative pentatricopeptide repeat-containing protein At1g12700, mitochondrial [Linum perenne]